MTNYRIGPDSDHIDPQKRGRDRSNYSFIVSVKTRQNSGSISNVHKQCRSVRRQTILSFGGVLWQHARDKNIINMSWLMCLWYV